MSENLFPPLRYNYNHARMELAIMEKTLSVPWLDTSWRPPSICLRPLGSTPVFFRAGSRAEMQRSGFTVTADTADSGRAFGAGCTKGNQSEMEKTNNWCQCLEECSQCFSIWLRALFIYLFICLDFFSAPAHTEQTRLVRSCAERAPHD